MSYAINPPSHLRTQMLGAGRAGRRRLASLLRLCPGSSLNFGPPREIDASTTKWLANHPGAGTFQILTPARTVTRDMPRYADEQIAARFQTMGAGRIKRRGVATFSDARFWGNAYGCVITADDHIQHEVSPTFADFDNTPPDPSRHDGLFKLKLPPLQSHPGTLAAINTFGHDNFHHWLLDTLPAFGQIMEAGIPLDSIDGFLLACHKKAFNRETLCRLGIDESRIIPVTLQTHLKPRRLIVPTYSEPGRQPELFNYTPEGLKFARSLFLDGRTPSPVDADKIVVNRARARARRLVHGDRIHERLRREGYVDVYLEDLSVAQQAALFRRVKRVIMPTGGGLANMVFSNPGTRLIELFSPAYLPTFCLPLCQALDQEYVALVGDDTLGGTGHHDAGNLVDIQVPEERILAYA